jgi:hypothetical protein
LAWFWTLTKVEALPVHFRCQFPAGRQEFRCWAGPVWAPKVLIKQRLLMKSRKISEAATNFFPALREIRRWRAAA